jgi:hypothetical protein
LIKIIIKVLGEMPAPLVDFRNIGDEKAKA